MGKVATFRVWTPDSGEVALDPASKNDPRLATFLQEVLDQGLWDQFRRFPLEVVARLLPRLSLPPARHRLLEIWIEEGQRKAAA